MQHVKQSGEQFTTALGRYQCHFDPNVIAANLATRVSLIVNAKSKTGRAGAQTLIKLFVESLLTITHQPPVLLGLSLS